MTDELLPRDPTSPWTTLGTRVMYENAWIRLREDHVIRPDGSEGIYGVVEPHAVATAVVALDAQDRVVLVGQYRYTLGLYSWEVPEGGSRKDEAPLAAAQRELREEAGLAAADWVQLGGPIHLSNCYTSEVGFAFLARELTDVGASPDGTEDLQLRRVPWGTCLSWLAAGEFTDAMTEIALTRAQRALGR